MYGRELAMYRDDMQPIKTAPNELQCVGTCDGCMASRDPSSHPEEHDTLTVKGHAQCACHHVTYDLMRQVVGRYLCARSLLGQCDVINRSEICGTPHCGGCEWIFHTGMLRCQYDGVKSKNLGYNLNYALLSFFSCCTSENS
jgi:hypothetical protein